MLSLHVIQAGFGDCLLLEFGDEANPRYNPCGWRASAHL